MVYINHADAFMHALITNPGYIGIDAQNDWILLDIVDHF